jgi:hypothetical protein
MKRLWKVVAGCSQMNEMIPGHEKPARPAINIIAVVSVKEK